eukprot:scaffold11258_cov44-Attheya_sp.AAC.3
MSNYRRVPSAADASAGGDQQRTDAATSPASTKPLAERLSEKLYAFCTRLEPDEGIVMRDTLVVLFLFTNNADCFLAFCDLFDTCFKSGVGGGGFGGGKVGACAKGALVVGFGCPSDGVECGVFIVGGQCSIDWIFGIVFAQD